ncbi:hypothetical protein [Undibacterium crateris]|uniref:hypothetical protein n=1 Tax=Undibacterium crateris TaxID=2528175 RepID=UPI00138992B7|nr:hypothetical protein [Undibacterium crateris]NDI85614.1 hypothetical protein [Undibacterium crateris]
MFKNASVKKTLANLCLITLITPAQFSTAGDGQSVDVIGQRDCSGILSEKCGWGDFGNGNGGDGGTGNIDPGREPGDSGPSYDELAQLRTQVSDIRCVLKALPLGVGGTEYSNVLSGDDEVTRQLAASSVQNIINLENSFRTLAAEILSYITNTQQNYRLTVTYADGGTEQWYVGSRFSTLKVISPVPGTWRQGTGKSEPSPNCPSFG